MVPSVRELADQYDLSINVVRDVLQNLMDEGLLYTVPRQGTFVGYRQSSSAVYLACSPYWYLASSPPWDIVYKKDIQNGFEERIANLGGTSLVITLDDLLASEQRGEALRVVGIFNFDEGIENEAVWRANPTVPRVVFSHRTSNVAQADSISFADEDGGRQATHHLLQLGHRRIAFLGFHQPGQIHSVFAWSAEREIGWRQTMGGAGFSTEGLAFHPAIDLDMDMNKQSEIARVAARRLIAHSDITAVVAANDNAAMGLFEALRDVEMPIERWPAVVGFDNLPHLKRRVVTSLRLPWEEVGRTAADLLWERHQGRLTGPPVHRQVPLRLLSRLTSRSGWPAMAGMAALVAPTAD